jgi:predicted butyrate kinase (DUF1464 family)
VPRVIGVDPGTVSVDLCGLEDGEIFLDQSIPTAYALTGEALPSILLQLHRQAPIDLVIGPSGYGLPLTPAKDLTEADLRLLALSARTEVGGIPGLTSVVRALGTLPMPVLLAPGVVHLPSVPLHRKINRVDMGTADKVCAAVLGVYEQMNRHACSARECSFILLELGGAFTAAIAVLDGQIVDGIGGTSGPIGLRAPGALDGEVAFLAGSIDKQHLFRGGVETIIASTDGPLSDALVEPRTPAVRTAIDAYVEAAIKAVATLTVVMPAPREILLSGRGLDFEIIRKELVPRLFEYIPGVAIHQIGSIATVAKAGAQGAALLADGLAGGAAANIVDTLTIRAASGSVLDFLHVIDQKTARARLGIL